MNNTTQHVTMQTLRLWEPQHVCIAIRNTSALNAALGGKSKCSDGKVYVTVQAVQRNVGRGGAEQALRRRQPLAPPPLPPVSGVTSDGVTLKLRGLPYSATVDDIVAWLAGMPCYHSRKWQHIPRS